MTIDAEQLDKEADAEYARLMGQAPDAQGQTDAPDSATLPPPDTVTQTQAVADSAQPPAQSKTDDWQDKYNKAEESRKNAHALMTQATQQTADLERSNQDLQQQMAQLQAQVNQTTQPPAQPGSPTPTSNDQFKELREDYEELNPVFNKLDEEAKRRQALENRLTTMEQSRQQQEQSVAQQQFWDRVREAHPDVDQVSQSSDFQGWFARQSPDVQEMSRVSPVGAVHVMTLYKQSGTSSTHSPHNTPHNTRMQQAQQLSEPQVRSRSQPTTQGG